MKTNYRNVLVLRKIKECTIKETAEILGWREDKVRITTTRAIKSLKKIWKNTYGDHLPSIMIDGLFLPLFL